MTYNVIITPKNGRFFAHVAQLPDCWAEDDSRDKVLALIRQRLEKIVKRIEIVQLEIPNLEKKFGKPDRPEKQNDNSQLKTKAAKQ